MITSLNGTFFVTEQQFKGGKTEEVGEGVTSSAVAKSDGAVYPVTAQMHRTLNLGNYESARVQVSITAFADVGHQDEVYDECMAYAESWLDAECAMVRGKKQSSKQTFDCGWAKMLVIGVQYGLTMNMGNFESARVDIGRSVPCHVHEIATAKDGIQQWLTSKIKERVAAVKNAYGQGSADVGL